MTYVIFVTFLILIINWNDPTIENYRGHNRLLIFCHFIYQKRSQITAIYREIDRMGNFLVADLKIFAFKIHCRIGIIR